MLSRKDLFDEKMTREKAERLLRLPSGSDAATVRAGRVGSHTREMPPEAIAMLDRVWSETVAAATGLGNHAELEEALRGSGG
jgi:hypothetical protein